MEENKAKIQDNKHDKKEVEEEAKQAKPILGIFSRKQFVMLCVGIGLFILLIVVTVTSVLITNNSESGIIEPMMPFPTDGDMLEFLLRNGEMREKDGLYATWYHSANSKDEMNKALESEVMILEADVNVQGHNTPNETNLPIMAHPPDVYSDNTLDEWLDTVLKSKKGIKLDFKSLQAVEPSLDILRIKNQTGINRPVWLNADVLPGPNVPDFWPVVNATAFFQLIQTKFPDVTLSPGWKVLYVPILPNVTYTQAMVEEMYNTVENLPQKITFPVLAVMVRRGWPHLSWLLSQSSRFSLTLWQGSENPTVNDLLFIRDNSHPQRIYYDIYEPVLSQFKQAVKQPDRQRRFYPGGDIVDYFKPANNDGLSIMWETVTDKNSLLSTLKDGAGGMLVIPLAFGENQSGVPVVEASQPELSFQACLDLILPSSKPWGLYLRPKSLHELVSSLRILQRHYDDELLFHPVWINMDISHGSFDVPGYITGTEFLQTINRIFPYVTLAPSWPPETLGQAYSPAVVRDMTDLFQNVWQEVSLQVRAEYLDKSQDEFSHLIQTQKRFSITVDHRGGGGGDGVWGVKSVQKLNRRRTFYRY